MAAKPIMDRHPESTNPQIPDETLLRLSFAPTLTVPIAEELSGRRDAPNLLTWLHNHHLCEQDAQGDSTRYSWVPRVRHGLQERARQFFVEAHLHRLEHSTAELLERHGLADDAISLLMDAQQWMLASQMLVNHANGWLDRGRDTALLELIARLPIEYRRTDPAICYLEGRCAQLTNPRAALRILNEGVQQALRQGNSRLTLACLAPMMATTALSLRVPPSSARSAWLALQPRSWRELQGREGVEFCLVHLYGAWLGWDIRPHTVSRAIACLEDILPDERDPVLRIQAATAAVIALTMYGALERARVLLERIELPAAGCFPAWLHIGWTLACAFLQLAGDDDSGSPLPNALYVGESLPPWRARLSRCAPFVRFTAALATGDVTCARELLQAWEARRHKRQTPISEQVAGELAHAWLALREAHSGAALAYTRIATELSLRASEPVAPLLRFFVSMTQAHALWQDGNIAAARSLSQSICHDGQLQGHPVLTGYAFMHEALIQHTVGDVDKLRAALSASLQSARRERLRVIPPFWSPSALSELCLDALEHGIEKPTAISLVRRHNLRAPSGRCTTDWPWPVKAFTFGTFGLQFDGVHEEVSGKAQRKVLELLKAIIAYGGRSVDVPLLASMIWPEANGDAAQSSFDITLHRLRKLLRSADSVVVADRKVSLNAGHIWVDAIEFSRLVRIGLDWLVPSYPPPKPESLVVLTHRVLDLYRADFLVQEEPQPWAIIARDKLRSQWLRFVTGVGQMLMQSNQLNSAITLYHRALESDPLAEELYRQLMRCYQRAGRHTEAVGVYRRCRDMFSILLGVAPADGTTVIYRECLTHS